MKIIEDLNYRQWQKRNTEKFNILTKEQKELARNKGYYNKGWQNVQKAWIIINKIIKNVIIFLNITLIKVT
jgi:hypothetical protein